MSLFAESIPGSVQPPPNAVDCLRCRGEGIEMICTDPDCIARDECDHARYDDCPACEGRGWVA